MRPGRSDAGAVIAVLGGLFLLLLMGGGAFYLLAARAQQRAETAAEPARAAAERARQPAVASADANADEIQRLRAENQALRARLDQLQAATAPPPRSASSEDAPAGLIPAKRLDAPEPIAAVIPWTEAARYLERKAAVEGTVVATHNSGRACFLNFDQNWRGKFHCVIFASAFPDFPPAPEEHYRGKRVRVTGKIKEHNGAPQIVLERPAQIEILE